MTETRPEFWWCLRHSQVERTGEKLCKAADRLGPYPDAATASRALSIVAQRNEAADEQDARWEDG